MIHHGYVLFAITFVIIYSRCLFTITFVYPPFLRRRPGADTTRFADSAPCRVSASYDLFCGLGPGPSFSHNRWPQKRVDPFCGTRHRAECH